MSEQNTDKAKLVTDILDEFNSFKEDCKEDTFLSVIHREHDENFISRIVAYTLAHEEHLLYELIKKYTSIFGSFDIIDKSSISVETVELEKYMGGRRADIFVKLLEPKITITIENKIYTWEHDDQTVYYNKWVTEHYESYQNIFIYLRPDFNMSSPSCDKFLVITYSAFKDMITGPNDPIICDLRKHIELNLEGNKMMFKEYEKTVVNNYEAFSIIINEVENKIKEKKNGILQKIGEKLINNEVLLERAGERGKFGVSSYRLYKKHWFVKDQYYFYVEILFKDNKKPLDLVFQQTINTYKNINEIRELLNKMGIKHFREEGDYIVIKDDPYESSGDWDTLEWEKDLENKAVDTLSKYIVETENLFNSIVDQLK